MGIAFDGDSDRIGAVDENGEVIYGDLLLLIYGREILTRKPGATFIGEVKCSQLLYDELKRLGGNPIMYKTGHSLIKAKMKEEHAELAGEMSGHMFFADRYFGYDDALYAACRLIEIVAKSGKPLSAQLAGCRRLISTPEIRVDCPDETKFDVVAESPSSFAETHKVIDVDGVRVLFDQGWGLLRASNTQPVLVMRFEAANERLLRTLSGRSRRGPRRSQARSQCMKRLPISYSFSQSQPLSHNSTLLCCTPRACSMSRPDESSRPAKCWCAATASPKPAPRSRIPPARETIDLGDARLLPGLIDAHVHLFLHPGAEDLQTVEESVPQRTILADARRPRRSDGRLHRRARHGHRRRRLGRYRRAQRHRSEA